MAAWTMSRRSSGSTFSDTCRRTTRGRIRQVVNNRGHLVDVLFESVPRLFTRRTVRPNLHHRQRGAGRVQWLAEFVRHDDEKLRLGRISLAQCLRLRPQRPFRVFRSVMSRHAITPRSRVRSGHGRPGVAKNRDMAAIRSLYHQFVVADHLSRDDAPRRSSCGAAGAHSIPSTNGPPIRVVGCGDVRERLFCTPGQRDPYRLTRRIITSGASATVMPSGMCSNSASKSR